MSPDTAPLSTNAPAEHSVPMFWPLAGAVALGSSVQAMMRQNLEFAVAAEGIAYPPPPEWATPNQVRIELKTMRLREFSAPIEGRLPVLIDAPYAGHSATIADFDRGQSLVETMLANGAGHVLVTDWKAATPAMRDFDIDTYLSSLNVAVDDLGGKVHLVGLCQGGWLSAMYAARFPGKVASLVLAGAPIDAGAGDGPIKRLANSLPLSTYRDMVCMGGGLMPGSFMLTGWKNMHPVAQYQDKYLALYKNVEDKNYLVRTMHFESWYEHAIDLPGKYYLQAIEQLFKDNRFAKGEFVGLGRCLKLADIRVPLFLLAGEEDDITTPEQVFNTAALVGTPAGNITKRLVPGGHIGLFMGRHTLADVWPAITSWIVAQEKALPFAAAKS